MRMSIKAFGIFLVTLAMLSILLPSATKASDLTDPVYAPKNSPGYKLDSSQAMWDEELQAYVIPLAKINGQLVPMNDRQKEQYLAEVNNVPTENTGLYVDEPDNIGSEIDLFYDYWIFDRLALYDAYLPTKRVTSNIYCTTPTCSISKQVSATVSAEFSTTVEAERKAIRANAGFTWVSSASDTSTYSFEGLVRGDEGYIGFRPLTRKTSGMLKKYTSYGLFLTSKEGYGYSPKKLSNGEAAGTYLFIYLARGDG